MTRYRPTVVEIDLDAIGHNVRLLRPPNAELMAVVKADGYGHGDAAVARAALEAGATRLGVSLVEEGLCAARARDRRADPGPDGVPRRIGEGGARRRTHAVGLLGRRPRGCGGRGQSRRPARRRASQARHGDAPGGAVASRRGSGVRVDASWTPGLRVEGVWTHFADSELDDEGTLGQLARFRAAVEALAAAGIRPAVVHAANSGATIRLPQTHLDLVRPGAAVYGLDPGGGIAEPFGLRPALSWRSAVTMVKRLPAGERVSYGGRYALRHGRHDRHGARRVRRRVPEACRREGGGADRWPATSRGRDDHDGPDPRGLRGRARRAGRRGGADRRPRVTSGSRPRSSPSAPARSGARSRPGSANAFRASTRDRDPTDEPEANGARHRRHRGRRRRGRRDRPHGPERPTPPGPRGGRAPVRAPARGPRSRSVLRRDRARRPRGGRPLATDDRVRPRLQPGHDDLALPVDGVVGPVPVRPVRLPLARQERASRRRRSVAAGVRPRPRGRPSRRRRQARCCWSGTAWARCRCWRWPRRNPSCSETRSRAWCSSARPRAISFAARSARSPSSCVRGSDRCGRLPVV